MTFTGKEVTGWQILGASLLLAVLGWLFVVLMFCN
jgi:hypothetical protein